MENTIESEARSYCRSFPARFVRARGSRLWDEEGREYIDFLSGCGALNYGHNHPKLAEALMAYIQDNGITHAMDLDTQAKSAFLEAFEDLILQPRKMNYRVQFTGPTGTNAVEAAIKLARKVTGRSNIIAFTNAFHGCTLGSLALTGNQNQRKASPPFLGNVTRMPFDGYFGSEVDTSDYLETMLNDPSSGVDAPAAIILETIQGEGGLNVATASWVKNVTRIAQKFDALLIVDDIQAGCGRSGDFFSFESLGINPDIVCLAKSISGFGLPMSLVLLKSEHDIWEPGEHNGTFRGNNLAFVTATEAIKRFWIDNVFRDGIYKRTAKVNAFLNELAQTYTDTLSVKGKGMMMGLAFSDPALAKLVQQDCFEQGLIIELCGSHDEVLKLLPPLKISADQLEQGLGIIATAVQSQPKDAVFPLSELTYG